MSQTASRQILANAESPRPVNDQVAPTLQRVYAPIHSELQQLEDVLRSELQSDTPFVEELLQHSWLLGGKRIRPVFLMLSAGCLGKVKNEHIQMAAALEMIHTATLIHDDILDGAETRRHRPTANSKWGLRQSLLLGDYLFTHAFHVGSQANSVAGLKMLAASSNRVCEGEMKQNAWQGRFDLSENEYLQMIQEKTAELCGVSCRLGALLSNGTSEVVEEFGNYGMHLGIAFQMIDDLLDLVGRPDQVGKTLGTDLVNQKPTLPVIHALQSLPGPESDQLRSLLEAPEVTVGQILPILEQAGSLHYTREAAMGHAQKAIDFASSLADGPYAQAMVGLGEFVIQRTH